MWIRSELKEHAKQVLHTNYWKFVLVALIFSIVGGSGGMRLSYSYSSAPQNSENFSYSHPKLPENFWMILAGTAIVALVIFFVIFIVSLALSIFLYLPLQTGCQRFFLKAQTENPSFHELVFAFSHHYKNIVKTMFLRSLYTALWSLLFIIPGIIKSYEYLMIPYILAENPDMDSEEVFALSKKMMDGDKWNAFVLSLSFIGWHFLSAFTCGILGIFYVNPYVCLTNVELYKVLKQKVGIYY